MKPATARRLSAPALFLKQKQIRCGGRHRRKRIAPRGSFDTASNISMEDFYALWIREVLEVEGSYKTNTVKLYKSLIRSYILPRFGSYKLKRITPRLLQNFLNEKKSSLSRSSLNCLVAVLKWSFMYAVDFGRFLPVSPALNIHVPRVYKDTPAPVKTFSREQMKKGFDKFNEEHKFYPAICTTYYVGLRIGECCALTWDDINMKKNEIIVRRKLLCMFFAQRGNDYP